MKILITSRTNEKVKQWRKLHTRKGRKQQQAFLIEGFHLIEEAWNSKQKIEQLIVEEFVVLPDWSEKVPVEIVSEEVFASLSQTKSPQGIAAILSIRENKEVTGDYFILIDGIQDPGNLGTIIRTADAAGMDAVILGKGTVDLYNDKVVRATQGSLFHIPIYEADLHDEVKRLKQQGVEIWATALDGASLYHEVERPNKVGLLLGNEGAGIQQRHIELADEKVKIPIYGKAESLNVSVAAGILMYKLKE
jgi:TrmH family RNA methyltransferase